MPDGTPTIQGGVVIISPHTDATTTQLQLLTALGADLSRIKIISFIRESAPEFHTGGHRPFSLPNVPPINEINGTAAITSNTQPANELNVTAATTSDTQPANPLLKPCPCGVHGPGCQCIM
jgi:hypothetical protein